MVKEDEHVVKHTVKSLSMGGRGQMVKGMGVRAAWERRSAGAREERGRSECRSAMIIMMMMMRRSELQK